MFSFLRPHKDPDHCEHEFAYLYQTEGSCRQQRQCIHCGQLDPKRTHRRKEHIWGNWQLAIDRCVEVMCCTRCGEQKEREVHHWGEWEAAAGQSCRQRRSCTLCGLTETKAGHTWGAWEPVAADACEQQAVCTQCGRVQYKGTKYVRCPECQHICLIYKRQHNPRPIKGANLATAAKGDLDWEYRNWPKYKFWYECHHCQIKLTETEYKNRTAK